MDDISDFRLPDINIGDLVVYHDYNYQPDVYSNPAIEDGSMGIVARIETTHMGYDVHYIMWLKKGILIATPRGNLKLAYSQK